MLTNRNPYGDPFSMINLFHLMQQSKSRFKSLPKEEQDAITAQREYEQEQKRVNACINQGKCPNCLGRLIRGKKDKKNEYKRTWKCLSCDQKICN